MPSNATDPQIELALSVGGSFFQDKELKIPMDQGPDHHVRVESPTEDLSPPKAQLWFVPQKPMIRTLQRPLSVCPSQPPSLLGLCLSSLPSIIPQDAPALHQDAVVCLSAFPSRIYQPFGPPLPALSVTRFLLFLPDFSLSNKSRLLQESSELSRTFPKCHVQMSPLQQPDFAEEETTTQHCPPGVDLSVQSIKLWRHV